MVQSSKAWLENHPIGIPLREGLIIIGWVAMWRPLEIFLYDWWPIASKRKFYDRLSRATVRIVGTDRMAAE